MDAAILPDLASDPHPGLREHVLRVAAILEHMFHKHLLATPVLIELAEDPAIRVRLHAAIALGDRCREEPAALDGLGKIASRDANDPWMRLAILSGLADSALAFLPICNTIPSPAAARNCNLRPPRLWVSGDVCRSWSLCLR